MTNHDKTDHNNEIDYNNSFFNLKLLFLIT